MSRKNRAYKSESVIMLLVGIASKRFHGGCVLQNHLFLLLESYKFYFNPRHKTVLQEFISLTNTLYILYECMFRKHNKVYLFTCNPRSCKKCLIVRKTNNKRILLHRKSSLQLTNLFAGDTDKRVQLRGIIYICTEG